MRTHAIVHLKNVVEVQFLEIDDRAEQIGTLVQQVQELQLQAPPAPKEDPDEANVMFGINED
jgi:proteasome assembly chaperone (PAC2) family protein